MIQLFILATRSWFSTMGALMGCPLSKSSLQGLSACFVRLATEVSSSTQALRSQYRKRSRFLFKGRNLQCVFLHLKESLSLSKVQNTLQLPDSSLVVWVQGAGGTFPSPWRTACMAPAALAAVIWGGHPRLEGQKLARSPASETSCTKANPQTRTSQALPCWNGLVLFPKAWSGGYHTGRPQSLVLNGIRQGLAGLFCRTLYGSCFTMVTRSLMLEESSGSRSSAHR